MDRIGAAVGLRLPDAPSATDRPGEWPANLLKKTCRIGSAAIADETNFGAVSSMAGDDEPLLCVVYPAAAVDVQAMQRIADALPAEAWWITKSRPFCGLMAPFQGSTA
ncbi:hypothetical protein ACFOD4_21175 [Pseudoroseomonas globiformis]|uniref:Uncharacterized protein n=1 Tax=Teichococcus globiformis TaxID=2307229 RepID=A0ABV7G7U6_9PROT